MKDLELKRETKVCKPIREPDHVSKRGIPYWWAPEWVRDLNGTITRIKPIKRNGVVALYMVSKTGNITFIRGSIQREFVQWHNDNQIDWILLGVDEDDILATDWEYCET